MWALSLLTPIHQSFTSLPIFPRNIVNLTHWLIPLSLLVLTRLLALALLLKLPIPNPMLMPIFLVGSSRKLPMLVLPSPCLVLAYLLIVVNRKADTPAENTTKAKMDAANQLGRGL
jgi:hypothetical protein